MPTLNALKAFEVAGSTGSFTRAAEILHVTQSAVSRQVRQLEDQLGKQLLIRKHHHSQLTDAGRLLLDALQQSFDQIEATVKALQDDHQWQRLRINTPPTFASRWLLPRLSRLQQSHPSLEVTLTSQVVDHLAESSLLDGAIRFGNGEWHDLQCIMLMQEKHIAVCSPALWDKLGYEQRVDLNRAPLLHVLATPEQRYMTWTHWLQAAGIDDVTLHSGHEFDTLDMAIRAAIDGLGVTIADRQMVRRQLASGQLLQIGDTTVTGHQSYWLVTRPGGTVSPAMEAFRRWLTAEVQLAEAWFDKGEASPYRRKLNHEYFE